MLVSEGLGAVLRYPLGYGMGWWGQVYSVFGTNQISKLWVEVMVQAWVYDGGLPLLIAYVVAICVVFYDTARIALTSRDREVAYWATVVFAMNFAVAATCFSYVTFLSPLGLNFWMLAAAVHAANLRVSAAAGPSRPRPRPRPQSQPRPAWPPRPGPAPAA